MSERVELAVADHNCTLCHCVELVWSAGFFDGEGCTHLNKNSLALHCSVSQREPKTLLRFQKAVGIGSVVGPYAAGTRGQRNPQPRYRWQTTSTEKSLVALRVLWPYLSYEKKKQAKLALKQQKFLKQERLEGHHPRKYYGR